MTLKKIRYFITSLINAYSTHNIASLSASLAYYTIFSLTPLLILCITMAGFFLGSELAHQRVVEVTAGLIDPATAIQIQSMLKVASKPFRSSFSEILGIMILIFGALGVFHEIQQGLNSIWGVKTNPKRPWLKWITDRIFSFAMVLVIAFLLLIFLVLSVSLTALSSYLTHIFGPFIFLGLGLNYLLSFLIISSLFAMMFKILPDVVIKWKEVWLGSMVTTVLFILGKLLLGLYFKYTNVGSIFGAAGSLIVILIWVYYSAQIFFIGAEITRLLAVRHHKKIIVTHDSVRK